MKIEDLTKNLAFMDEKCFDGCAPQALWSYPQTRTWGDDTQPLWRAVLQEPESLAVDSLKLLRRLFRCRATGELYVQAFSGVGTFWAKVPDALRKDVLALFPNPPAGA